MSEKAKELCNTVLDYMDELCPVIIELYKSLREYDLTEISVLSDISEGLAWLSEAATALGKELKLDIIGEADIINSQIKEIALAMENCDYMYLTDVLEFDVIPNMEKIFNILRDV